MSERIRGSFTGQPFRDRERQSMLGALPEPELCAHEFSPEFQAGMKRLFTRERVQTALHTVRRWAGAVILLFLFGAGAVLAVDTEARASFFEWVRKFYENSIVYEFSGRKYLRSHIR